MTPDQELRNVRQGSINRWLDGDLGTFYLEIMMEERKKSMSAEMLGRLRVHNYLSRNDPV